MSILENFTETTYSYNLREPSTLDEIDEIVVGSTTTHIFEVPFKYSEVVDGLEIIYKQGFNVILVKNESNVSVEEIERPCDHRWKSIITLVLPPEDTELFGRTYMDTYVQIKIYSKENETLYTNKSPIKVVFPLDIGE